MRTIVSFLLISLLFACETDLTTNNTKTTTEYLDKANLYIFQKGDTILYKSKSAIDSFVVTENSTHISNYSKQLNIESEGVELDYLHFRCQENNVNYCFIAYSKSAVGHPNVTFRNIHGIQVPSSTISYTLSNNVSLKVYKMNSSSTCSDTIPKSVRTVYYSQKYGIVAYELCSGAVFEIQNIKASK